MAHVTVMKFRIMVAMEKTHLFLAFTENHEADSVYSYTDKRGFWFVFLCYLQTYGMQASATTPEEGLQKHHVTGELRVHYRAGRMSMKLVVSHRLYWSFGEHQVIRGPSSYWFLVLGRQWKEHSFITHWVLVLAMSDWLFFSKPSMPPECMVSWLCSLPCKG